MRLFIVRHGIAVDRDTPGILSDGVRELTPEGVRKMQRNARALHRMGVSPQAIWSSPLVRARQSAQILADVLGLFVDVRLVSALEPGGSLENLLKQVADSDRFDSLMMVGHEPQLSELAAFLIGGESKPAIVLKKGGVICVEIDSFEMPVRGSLLWILTPKLLGMID